MLGEFADFVVLVLRFFNSLDQCLQVAWVLKQRKQHVFYVRVVPF